MEKCHKILWWKIENVKLLYFYSLLFRTSKNHFLCFPSLHFIEYKREGGWIGEKNIFSLLPKIIVNIKWMKLCVEKKQLNIFLRLSWGDYVMKQFPIFLGKSKKGFLLQFFSFISIIIKSNFMTESNFNINKHVS